MWRGCHWECKVGVVDCSRDRQLYAWWGGSGTRIFLVGFGQFEWNWLWDRWWFLGTNVLEDSAVWPIAPVSGETPLLRFGSLDLISNPLYLPVQNPKESQLNIKHFSHKFLVLSFYSLIFCYPSSLDLLIRKVATDAGMLGKTTIFGVSFYVSKL